MSFASKAIASLTKEERGTEERPVHCEGAATPRIWRNEKGEASPDGRESVAGERAGRSVEFHAESQIQERVA